LAGTAREDVTIVPIAPETQDVCRMTLRTLSVVIVLAAAPTLFAQDERAFVDSWNRANQLKQAFMFEEADAEYQRALTAALKVYGEEHKNTGAVLTEMGDLYERQGKFAEAEKAYLRNLKVREKLNGESHVDVGAALMSLATVEIELGKFVDAEKMLNRALAIREKDGGEESAAVADTLNDLAILASRQGKTDAAERLYRRSLIIRQKTDGPDSTIVAQSLSNLGLVLHELEQHIEAEQLHRRALEIREKVRGADHPVTAESLHNLAILYRDLGRYPEAEELNRRAFKIREATLGAEHVRTLSTVNNLAVIFRDQGKYPEAEGMFLRALAVQKKVNGPSHPTVAETLGNLAMLNKSRGRPIAAERFHLEAIDAFEKSLGKDHPAIAEAATQLGSLYEELGRHSEAETLYRRALAIKEKALGPQHPAITVNLSKLANFELSRNQPAAAKPFVERSLAIREKVFGTDHPAVTEALDELASAMRRAGDPKAAEPLFAKSLAIRTKIFGKDHEGYGDALYHLAQCHAELKRFDDAVMGYRAAIVVYETSLGKNHPHMSEVYTELANALAAQGKAESAREARQAAFVITVKALGRDHPTVAAKLTGLAEVELKDGKRAEAATLIDEQRRAARRYMLREAPYLTEHDRRKYLEADAGLLARALQLGRGSDADTVRRSAEWLLNGKSVKLEVRTLRARLDRDADTTTRAALVDLHDLRLREAALAPRQIGPAAPAVQAQRVQLFKLRRELEQKLNLPADLVIPWVELDAVRKAIPADGVLVEIARLDANYVAWIIPSAGKGSLAIVDLGDAKAVDAGVQLVRQTLAEAPSRAQQIGEPKAEAEARDVLRKLSELVLKPIASHLKDVKTLIISPDGELWLAPWAALPLDGDKYLVESISPRLVVSGRDLVRPTTSAKLQAGPPLVIAAPDFDAALTASVFRLNGMEGKGRLADFDTSFHFEEGGRLVVRIPEGAVIGQGIWRQEGESITMETASSLYTGRLSGKQLAGERRFKAKPDQPGDRFLLELVIDPSPAIAPTSATKIPPVPWTKAEGQAASGRLKWLVNVDAKLLMNVNASETAVKSATRPPFLVFATHSVVFPPAAATSDPLSRCGVLLAGANKRTMAVAGQDDGALVGSEVLSLDLRGTKLVVMSACETGVRGGDGVAAFRQAFQIAGAADVLSTLWPIPDGATAKFMDRFYDRMIAGSNRSLSLAEAQRATIEQRRKENGAAHPYLWATFSVTGRD
jgi:tetratricopeptide (TPR) repeat protein